MTTAKKQNTAWRYGDYLCWADDHRWELIDGVAYNMTPAPSTRHQEIVGNVYFLLRQGLSNSTNCQTFDSPIDVLLPLNEEADEQVGSVVQPDVLVICDRSKITEQFIRGAPDLIVEVISPSTAKKDEGIKRDLYERVGVAEYWLVHPVDHTINRYTLTEGQYHRSEVFGLGDTIVSTKFTDLSIKLSDIFGQEPEPTPQPT